MVVVVVALILTAGGSATAGALITGKQIKNSSITGADVKNKSLSSRDFSGSVRGPKGSPGGQGHGFDGAQGPQGGQGVEGATGPAGTATAYGTVSAAGTLSNAKAMNSVTKAGSFYCLNVAAPVNNVVATLDYDLSFSDGTVFADTGTVVGTCPVGTNAYVFTSRASTGATAQDFMFVIN